MSQINILENDITGSIGTSNYICTINWRNGVIMIDEPTNLGGQDTAPDPYTTLLAALAGCTLSTLRMYIDRKGWVIPDISVQLNMSQDRENGFTTFIKRDIYFSSDVPSEQKDRLLVIAGKCPVSKILENNVSINTTI
jgi:putative redox protein